MVRPARFERATLAYYLNKFNTHITPAGNLLDIVRQRGLSFT